MKNEYVIPIMLMLLTCVGIIYTAIYSEPPTKRKDIVLRQKFIEDSVNEYYSIKGEKKREEERIKQHADSLDMYKPYDFIEFRERGNNSDGFSLRFFKNGLIIWRYSSSGGERPFRSEVRYTHKKDSNGLLRSTYHREIKRDFYGNPDKSSEETYYWELVSESYIDQNLEIKQSMKAYNKDNEYGSYYFNDVPDYESEKFLRKELGGIWNSDYHTFLINAYLRD